MNMEKKINELFVPYELAVKLKALGFDEPCLFLYNSSDDDPKPFLANPPEPMDWNTLYTAKTNKHLLSAPTFSQAINFLYICSNKQIDIELKASDTYEERLRKVDQGCEDLRNLQNSKPN